MRADAQRNRTSILETAFAAFAAEGLSVPVAEIARRAGVGTGTVSRHFPTKESLFTALIEHRAGQVLARGRELERAHPGDPGAAFFAFYALLTTELAVDRGLADALAGAGIDLESTEAGQAVTQFLADLLGRAQAAGSVRPDVALADIKSLMTGCLAELPSAPADVHRRLSVVRAGLRASDTGPGPASIG